MSRDMGIVLLILAGVLGVAYYTGALEPFIAQLASQVPGTGTVRTFKSAAGAGRSKLS